MSDEAAPTHCDFCGRPLAQTFALVFGRRGAICDACIDEAAAILRERRRDALHDDAQAARNTPEPKA